MFLEIHLWCDTYRPLGSQHGSWTILFHVSASRHWWGPKPGSIVPLPHSVSKIILERVQRTNVGRLRLYLFCLTSARSRWAITEWRCQTAMVLLLPGKLFHIYSFRECRFCVNIPSISPFLWAVPLIFLTDTLTDRMGVQPILPIKVSITTGNDSDFDGHGDGYITCKHTI